MSVCAQIPQLVAVGGGHPEHLGDHLEREREGEVGDDVEPTSAVAATTPSSAASTSSWTRGASCSIVRGVNTFWTSRADPGVVGRVEVEDRAGAPLRPFAEDPLAELGAGVDAGDAACPPR